ncbi:MAG: hypothetical protein ACKOC5_06110 [Chloroflexota bacterium]
MHQEIQSVFLLLTRRMDLAIILFSLLFFPGVLLHEVSHFLAARLLRVRTGRFSVFPQPLPGGRLQLGYVETAAADPLRDTLIGAAPLISGGLFVGYSGLYGLGLLSAWNTLQAGGSSALTGGLTGMLAQPDFWLWFYLTLVVSSTMMPSASDRRGWLPVGLVLGALLAVSLFAGAGPWLAETLAPLLNRFLSAAATVMGISALVHLLLLPPVWLARRLLSRLTGLQVVL